MALAGMDTPEEQAFLAAMAMIYGFVRRLIKKRAYKDEEEEDWE